MARWGSLSDAEKDALLARRTPENIADLAREQNMHVTTLDRRLREWKQIRNSGGAAITTESVTDIPANITHQQMFTWLKDTPVSLAELSRRMDRSEATVLRVIEEMEAAGYAISRSERQVAINTLEVPKAVYAPARTLADEVGHDIVFGVISDTHAGSIASQPSAIRSFVDIAQNEYGVQHIVVPGDVTAGVNGYRGQELDLVPAIRPAGRDTARTTQGQIWLADSYLPHRDGLKWLVLGGNHDWWHVVNSGIDAVAQLARLRDDMVYLGYDVADVPLTDRISMRLWHPSGGVPYALSYRLQKGVEAFSFQEMLESIMTDAPLKIRLLLAGHLHVEGKFQRGAVVAAQCGCFEGSTNYLKRKGLFPQIGGAIFRLRVTDSGLLQRVEYTFIPYMEVENDWANFATPPQSEVVEEPDVVETLFHLA